MQWKNAALHFLFAKISPTQPTAQFDSSSTYFKKVCACKRLEIFTKAPHTVLVIDAPRKFHSRLTPSATELCGLLKDRFGGEYFANRLTRDLFRKAYELRDLGVTFEPKRSNGQRLLLLRYDKNSDSSDGKMLMPEQPKTADPTVTPDSTDCADGKLGLFGKVLCNIFRGCDFGVCYRGRV